VISRNDDRPTSAAGQAHVDSRDAAARAGVAGNERLTALAGAALLVLLVIELVTVPALRVLLAVHVFVGVLLAGPLVVKLGSTGYRFLRYYTGAPAFVRKGPPRLGLRLLAPLLVATTLLLVGSGIGLLVTGPILAGPLRTMHAASALLWLSLIAVHVFAYVLRALRLIADDWRTHAAEHAPGRGLRLGVIISALLVGTVTAALLLPAAAPWISWVTAVGQGVPGVFIAGVFAAVLAVAATKQLSWW
jgi:hypothetical protein